MLFYDFEVFKYDWLVVIKDTDNQSTQVIVNDPEKLEALYQANINNIWCGYNSRSYDQYILKAILAGYNPKDLNDWIIKKGRMAWQFSSQLYKIPLNNYDVMTSFHGLKQLEGFMGNDIRETQVPFDIDRKLTPQELDQVIKYCIHDVEQTMEVFINRIEEFESHMSLIKAFNLPLKYVSKTKAQLSAIILEANKRDRNDEFDITIVDTLRINKYKEIMKWYENPENRDYSKELSVEVAGVPHIFAWGGLHGARNNYIGDGIFINSDVGSFYPALMIEYSFLSRNVRDPEKFREIRDKRMELKKKKDPMQQPYKIVLNSTYGASKDKYNNLFDPLQANNVCINGQLMLLDLIEKLENKFMLIQSNTDGVMFKLNSKDDIPLYEEICKEWEKRTRMTLEHEIITKVVQKDVNNYIVIHEDGEVKSKGAYVKKLKSLDYDLPIVNRAVMDYFIKGMAPEATINNCSTLRDFQKIVKVSSKYLCAYYGDEKLTEKTLRVFASRSLRDKGVTKVKSLGATREKISYTPERCFIDNSDISTKGIPRKLDKQWYIDMAWKRIKDFIGE